MSTPLKTTSSSADNISPASHSSFNSSKSSHNTQKPSDRFIPNRGAMNMEVSNYHLLYKENNVHSAGGSGYATSLATKLFNEPPPQQHKILAFKEKPKPRNHPYYQRLLDPKCSPVQQQTHRVIPPHAEKILDAPDMLDDYYLNLLDWSANGVISVALNTSVYLWNSSDGTIVHLAALPEDVPVTCVTWCADGNTLAIGTDASEVQLWDVNRRKRLRTMRGHAARVGAMSWNNCILATGSRDTNILLNDVRIRDHKVKTLACHTQEVCGLKYSPDGSQLASGGNDNRLCIWDTCNGVGTGGTGGNNNALPGPSGVSGPNLTGNRGNSNSSSICSDPRFVRFAHCAAVKALGWAPFQKNLLASGGGSVDRTIRFWNTTTGDCLNHVDAGSQVASLVWSKISRELLTSHGYSDFQLSVWKYPSLTKLADLKGHDSRVLYTALSPDGHVVVSAAGDETIRFWRVFESEPKKVALKSPSLKSINIR